MTYRELMSGDYFKLSLPKEAEFFFTVFAGSEGRNGLYFRKIDVLHAVSQLGNIEHFSPGESVQYLETAPHGWPEGL